MYTLVPQVKIGHFMDNNKILILLISNKQKRQSTERSKICTIWLEQKADRQEVVERHKGLLLPAYKGHKVEASGHLRYLMSNLKPTSQERMQLFQTSSLVQFLQCLPNLLHPKGDFPLRSFPVSL